MSLIELEELSARLDKLEKEIRDLWEMFAIRKAWRLHSKDHEEGGKDEIKGAIPITAYPEALLIDGSRDVEGSLTFKDNIFMEDEFINWLHETADSMGNIIEASYDSIGTILTTIPAISLVIDNPSPFIFFDHKYSPGASQGDQFLLLITQNAFAILGRTPPTLDWTLCFLWAMGVFWVEGECAPYTDNLHDLGDPNYRWRRLYLSDTAFMHDIRPETDDAYDLGYWHAFAVLRREWRNLYLDGIAYIDELRVEEILNLDAIDIGATSVAGLSGVIPVIVAGTTKYIPVYDSYA